ncbi:D-alanyl-D-alanine carboxypeptidase family protein [Roseateles saccharophilus]|uniref:serine-type D-Ala-D-Ala carboxypeptidase n=1 Tax=Roseateles saccharophilus TaxID=304 RepID=A0A4R3U843_ROSSA|nr:D-alanyl-D-alanine carboxypeptidase family protein [Roseateles saccharophilus]MDG0835721.1 D-alanyl-D-alanine carboxypeptidase [Roseateles saccharophilus]TCU84047.1 penicillin-binding protein 6 [Roseateles saccharophilus]
MTHSPRTSPLLPCVLATAVLFGLAGTACAAAHAKPRAAAHKSKPAASTEPATTTDANGRTVPLLDNKAWVLMDFSTGQILASSNADEPLPPASLTKMMTSYLVEQGLKSGKLKPDEPVTMSLSAWCRGGKGGDSCMFVPLNAQVPLMDMLRGVVIDSGNDASKALAEHVGGSESGFAAMMNAEAAKLGMAHSHFENSAGLPDPRHKASARDLAVLAQAIIRNSAEYYPIYAEREFTYNGIKQGNRNALLYTDPTVDGLKTGHTEEAGYCLTASAKRNGMRLISVIMNANSAQARADQTRVLFNWGYSNFEAATPAQAGAPLATAKVRYGVAPDVAAGIAQPWSMVIPKGQGASVKTAVTLNPELEAPIAKGAVIGKVVATADGKQLGEAPLVALAGVERAGFFLRIRQRVSGWFTK